MNDLDLANAAAVEAAEIVRAMFDTSVATEMKGAVDPVTAADRAAEVAILDMLGDHRPSDTTVAEEGGGRVVGSNDRRWFVDPLDGTVNFVHGIPHCAVSVALWDQTGPAAAAIVDIMREDVYTAARGEGASLNGAPIETSSRAELVAALVGTGFPYDRDTMGAVYADWVGAVLPKVRGIRRMGSAALDFAYVACGRLDAYFEHGLSPWDAAGGLLLVAEAGGHTVDLDGRPADLDSSDFIATSASLYEPLSELIRHAAPIDLRPGS